MSGVRTDVAARCHLTQSFLKDLLEMLRDEDAMWVRVKLGAEHLEQFAFALNSLKALEEVVDIHIGDPTSTDTDALDIGLGQ